MTKPIEIEPPESGIPADALDTYEQLERVVRWTPKTEQPLDNGAYQNVHSGHVFHKGKKDYVIETRSGTWLLHELGSVVIVDDENKAV